MVGVVYSFIVYRLSFVVSRKATVIASEAKQSTFVSSILLFSLAFTPKPPKGGF
jgi:hypothetical protein